jgi:hypothetical protein
MKIMGKCSDSAAARKVIPDEGDTLKQFHLVVSGRPALAGANLSAVLRAVSADLQGMPALKVWTT